MYKCTFNHQDSAVSDPGIYKKLAELETTDNRLSSEVNGLTLEVRLMVQSMQLMQKTLEKLTDVEGKFTNQLTAVVTTQSDVNHKFDKRIENAENVVRYARFLGAGVTLALIGIAVAAIFGGKGP
jgi:hypothetical protein